MTSVLLHDGPHVGSIVDAEITADGTAVYYGWNNNRRRVMSTGRYTISTQGRRWPTPKPQADPTTRTRNQTRSADMGTTWDDNEHRRAARQAKAERIIEFLIVHGRDLLGIDDTTESLHRLADALDLASTRREPHDDALWESLGQFAACKSKPSHVTQAMVTARLRSRAEAAAMTPEQVFAAFE